MVTSSELSNASSALPGDSLGRYRLIQKIARGGMAEVFAARSYGAHGFEKTVAIKRILPRFGDDPQFVRMMVDEAKITVLLNHPNVATILELAEQDGDYFIVMEFVPGLSLSSVVKKLRERDEKMGKLEACFVVVELLQGLHAAHVQKDASGRPANIIHRDVSPQNVLLSFDGHVKVIDFGIARATRRLEMTEIGTIKGKLRYLAPEMIDPARFMKDGDFDHRVDVFAAGIVLWELIANKTLYQGDDEMVVYDSITDTDAPSLSSMGADNALAKIAAKALTRDPEKRYLNAEDFADDLRAYVYRTDPAFTHKRISTVMERLFPVEKEQMLTLERGGGIDSGPVRVAPTSSPKQQPPKEATQNASGFGPMQSSASAVFTSNPPSSKDALSPSQKDALAKISEAEKKKARSSQSDHSGGSAKPAPADAPTRTIAAADVNAPTDFAGPAEPTRAMRSDSASLKRLADRKPQQEGDVLTVMTLVSKPSLPRAGALTAGLESAVEGFAAQQSTVTAPEKGQLSGAASADETPYTQERGPIPSRASRSMSRQRRQASSSRVLALVAASIAGIAVFAIVAIVLSRPTTPEPIAPPPKQTVQIAISSSTPGAIAVWLDKSQPTPAHFDVIPGDTVEVTVKAPGYQDKTEHVSVPMRGAHDETRDVELTPLPLALHVVVKPADATVTVDDAPYQANVIVDANKSITISASAPGYIPLKRTVTVTPSSLEQAIELEKADAPAVEKKNTKAAVVDNKPAKLKIMSTNMWGQVTIDGKKYDDTTPLVVELRAGKHNVVVAHDGKASKTFTVTLKPGETVSKTVTFE